MATVQNTLLKLLLRIDPRTERQQLFQNSSGTFTITGAADNGSGLIRITAAGHGLIDDNQVYITGITGTTEANNTAGNPSWLVTKISSSQFDLQGSTFTNVYVSGGSGTGALVGSVDGGRFSRQRQLDIYNEARMLMLTQNLELNGKDATLKLIHGAVVADTSINFAGGVATIPTGFVQEILLNDPSGNKVSIIEARHIASVQNVESASNKFVYKAGTQLKALSTTYIANGTYRIWYQGITDFVLSDVIGGTTVETIDEDMIPDLILIAEAVALEHGLVSPLELTRLLLAKKAT